jgi:acetate CoA/acetoacetate CoA-transferase alpha subunit
MLLDIKNRTLVQFSKKEANIWRKHIVMCKLKEITEALETVTDGATMMIGGFMGVGAPHTIIEALVEKEVKSLTVISNDAGTPGAGVGKLVENQQIEKLVASHIGLNPMAGKQMNNNEMAVELVPQGTLAEQIRAGSVGLGGVLTPTGLGTIVEEGKQVIESDGKKFILEKAMKAQVALVKAYKADKKGNLVFRQTARNFNPIMAGAADYVIAEVEEYVDDQYLPADEIHLPGLFIDAIVLSKNGNGNNSQGDA